MAGIREYSTTAGSNTSINGISVAEGCPPSAVNDAIRQAMADTRSFYESGGWIEWGHTCTYASGTTFTVAGDVTAIYHANRRVRVVGTSTGTIYGKITGSIYIAPNTTVTLSWDSGSLSNEALTVSVGWSGATGKPIDYSAIANPMTTRGDIIYRGASDAARLGAGTAGQVLVTGGPGADPSWSDIGGSTETVTAGEDLADRNIIYQDIYNQRSGGSTKWYKVDTDATSPVKISPRLGIALAAITSGATGIAQVRAGRVSSLTGLTAGQRVYCSTTAGGWTQTEPPLPSTGTQVAMRAIGVAASATEIDFDPDPDTLFVKYESALAVGGSSTIVHWTDGGGQDREVRAYVASGEFGNTATVTLDANNYAGYTGYSFRQVISAAQISTSGSQVKVVFNADTGRSFAIDKAYIGHKAASGNAWDFDGNQVQLTFSSGSAGFSISAGASITSDAVAFALDETKDLIIAFDWTNSGTLGARGKITQSGWTAYVKNTAGTDESSVTAPSGYLAGDNVVSISAVQVLSATRYELVDIGSPTIDSSSTTKVNVRFDDGAGANSDTTTTFTNRTGATRALVFEVDL